ncbi:unnamed protein product, partial [marine sediment metagenome]
PIVYMWERGTLEKVPVRREKVELRTTEAEKIPTGKEKIEVGKAEVGRTNKEKTKIGEKEPAKPMENRRNKGSSGGFSMSPGDDNTFFVSYEIS